LELCRRAGRLEGEGRPAGDAAADLGGAPIQLLGDGQAVAVLIGRRIAEAEGCILLPQVYARGAALAGDGGGCVGRDRTIVRDRECRGKYKSGAHAVGVVVPAAVVVAARADVPDVVGVVRVRRAGPPAGGRTVVLCNTFLVGCRAGSGGEVIQLRAVLREIRAVALGPAQLIAGRQEDFAAQAVGAGCHRTAAARTIVVRDLYLLDGLPDIRIEQIQEGSVQPAVDVRIFVVVVGPVPLSCGIDVLHQQPGAVAAVIVQAGRLALVHNDEVLRTAVQVQFEDRADGLGAEFHICYDVSSWG